MAFCVHPGKFWMSRCFFFAYSWKFPHKQMVWKILEYFPRKKFWSFTPLYTEVACLRSVKTGKINSHFAGILPKNSEKTVSSKSGWKGTAGTIVNISHTWAGKLKIVSNLFSCFSDERGYVWGNWCRQRGSCTKDGITRHLSRLAGANDDDDHAQDDDHGHDDDDHAHDELVDMCKNHETVLYAIQGLWLWTC